MIEFDLPDNDTVLREIKTADVAWGIWGYSGCTKAKPVQRWIPCSERLPEYGTTVLTCNHDGEYEINHIIDEEDREWFWDGAVAWMPLPTPYREGGQDNG